MSGARFPGISLSGDRPPEIGHRPFSARPPAARVTQLAPRLNQLMTQGSTLRSRAGIARFPGHLELLEPGLAEPRQWRPGELTPDDGRQVAAYCGLAREP